MTIEYDSVDMYEKALQRDKYVDSMENYFHLDYLKNLGVFHSKLWRTFYFNMFIDYDDELTRSLSETELKKIAEKDHYDLSFIVYSKKRYSSILDLDSEIALMEHSLEKGVFRFHLKYKLYTSFIGEGMGVGWRYLTVDINFKFRRAMEVQLDDIIYDDEKWLNRHHLAVQIIEHQRSKKG